MTDKVAIDHQALSVDVMVDENAYQDETRDGHEFRYLTRIGTLTITGFWPRPRVRVRPPSGEVVLQGMKMAGGHWSLLAEDPAALFALEAFTPDADYIAEAGIGV